MPSDALDLYLDGLLDEERAAAFERALEEDPALRGQAELQRRVDGSLRSVFRPGAAGPIERGAGAAIAAREARGPRILRIGPAWLLAASVAVLVAGAGGAWLALRPSCDFHPLEPVSAGTYYERIVSCGFRPDWRCETDEQMREATTRYLGVAMTVAAAPGLEVVGWLYDSPGVVLRRSSLTLLARVEGEPVVVVLDAASQDPGPPAVDDPALRVHRGELGGVVLYEITPWDEAGVIGRFRPD